MVVTLTLPDHLTYLDFVQDPVRAGQAVGYQMKRMMRAEPRSWLIQRNVVFEEINPPAALQQQFVTLILTDKREAMLFKLTWL